MFDALVNVLKDRVGSVVNTIGVPRIGVVSSYNPNDGTARVLVQPEGTMSGWIPVASQSVGAGWGLHTPLQTGEQVIVLPIDGDSQNPVVVGRLWSNQMRPPVAAGGEMVLRHSSGSYIQLAASGAVTLAAVGTATISDNAGAVISLQNNSGAITVIGTMNVVGVLKINGTTVIAP